MRKLRRVLSLFLVLIMVGTCNLAVNAEEVTYISAESDLKKIADNPSGHYILTGDIVLSGEEWSDLGDFSGVLDGAGYSISNLTSASGEGLFDALTREAVVKNLTVSGNIRAEGSIALLAVSSQGTIQNCTASGSVSVAEWGSAGGLVTYNYGHMEECVNEAAIENGAGGIAGNNFGSIVNCKNKGNIVSDGMYPGGIAGSNNGVIIGCQNEGRVTATLENTNLNLAAGGITGQNGGLLLECVNLGEVHADIARSFNIGGIAGEMNGFSQVIACENKGTIIGTGAGHVGGICGDASLMSGIFNENGEFVVNKGELLIANCNNSGAVFANAIAGYGMEGGGIAGAVETAGGFVRLVNCLSSGVITGTADTGGMCDSGGFVGMVWQREAGSVTLENLHNSGKVTANSGTASGFVGRIQNETDTKPVIRYCENEGDINGTSANCIGGIAGKAIVQYCANRGNISGEYVCGLVSYISEASEISDSYSSGTLSGDMVYGAVGIARKGVVFKNCYVAGDLQGVAAEYAVCGEVAESEDFGVNCYYEQQELLNEQVCGVALSSADMEQESAYAGFDFTNVWEMKEQNGRMLPALREPEKSAAASLKNTEVCLKVGDVYTLEEIEGGWQGYYSANYVIFDGEDKMVALGIGDTAVYYVSADGQVLSCTVHIEADEVPVEPTPTPKPSTPVTPTEEVKAFVNRMYEITLGRGADEAGFAVWTNALANYEMDGAGIAQGFVLSEEFVNKGLSNEEYVDAMYRVFFDREGDPDGKAFWVAELEKGSSRTFVLAGFVNSQEFSDLCDSFQIARGTMQQDGSVRYNKGVRDFVVRLYEKVLERDGETLGIEDWTNWILLGTMTPEDAAKSFFHSQEYLDKHTVDDAYVETLYRAFMDRESDNAGKATWLSLLSDGMSRDEVLEGFSQSQEFKEIMSRYGL